METRVVHGLRRKVAAVVWAGRPAPFRPESRWHRRLRLALRTVAIASAALVCAAAVFTASVLYHVYFNRENLPDLGPFTRFEFHTVGHVYDTNGRSLIELAREHRLLSRYEEIPQVVREAILATEDKRFFNHNGVDYGSIPRVLVRIRMRTLIARVFRNPFDEADSPAIFPQGGSTITQQLVRGHFLKGLTAGENSRSLQGIGRLTRSVAYVLGARNANMIARKVEELRLSLWIEEEMTRQFGTKRRAKEELFARYASYVYMGNGQYGFAIAAQYYFGRPLATFTAADVADAAVLAGIPKSPRDNAPSATDTGRIVRRRNQTLALMAAEGFISPEQEAAARQEPAPIRPDPPSRPFQSSAVVAHVLDEFAANHPNLGVEDLLLGHIQVHSTVDLRIQRIANEALQHGLDRYEQRHPSRRGITQGSVVVLRNGDGAILAEVGGRQTYEGRATSYSDFNRVTESFRQPGSAMKPIVYLAAFLDGALALETVVPDEPISVPNGTTDVKWISNYDGRFKGSIPIRQALAESRNAVAIWITGQVGIDRVLRTARSLGIETRLHRYPTTALGASEVSLLELATAYRTMASGVLARPYVIRQIVRRSGEVIAGSRRTAVRVAIEERTLALIQEGLRGVIRIPGGTAHALDAHAFAVPVMGKTGTTNEFRDAIFVGSTYGVDGITVAVRIGFDDNRSLGRGETGARLAVPVFRDVMMAIYQEQLAGPVPSFPDSIEAGITTYLQGPAPPPEVLAGAGAIAASGSVTFTGSGTTVRRSGMPRVPLPAESLWLLEQSARAAAASAPR
jgi:penicillin-binding protein 1A